MLNSTVARPRRQAPRRAAPVQPTLSLHLSESTREEHVAVEAAFALDTRLAGRDAYAGLLAGLRGFYAPVEAALAAVAGWSSLTPPIDVGSRRRLALLDADSKRLGIGVPRDGAVAAPPALKSLAHGLGCLYVVEGSALGGRIVARRARATLGDDLPVAFFSSAGRDDLMADWRRLQAALDAFGAGHPAAAGFCAVTAARATFNALREWLERAVPLP